MPSHSRLYRSLHAALSDTVYVDGDHLDVSKILSSIDGGDDLLIECLLGHDETRTSFFKVHTDALVLDTSRLLNVIRARILADDQLTQYRNKIGLSTIAGDPLIQYRKVVLTYPYKDAVLVGAQTKETKATPDRFLHETIHEDDIDRLYSPKALTDWRRYDQDGPSDLHELSIQDNLILKGNNLLVLHSLLPVYREGIKLIYIDPPYNTTHDSFRYLDNFSHSSWLTFMKNRLAVAKELLHEDGLLWISISDREAHYLKVLLDEIMGRDNFVADVIWNSTKSVTNTAVISDAHTHTLLYAKDISRLKALRETFRLAADESKFSNPDNDPKGKWVADPFQVGGVRPNQLYTITNPNTGVEYIPNPGNSWKNEKKVFDQLMAEGRIIFGTKGESGPQRKRYWSEAKDRGQVTTTLWKDLPTTTNGTAHLKNIFSTKVFDNPKPEALLERIIQLSTSEGDIVLDYHLGSGTTAAAAHKMNRRYIGIEQMDYIEEVSCARLLAVIKGEQGGISKNQNWKGGGSFVYAALMPLSAKYIHGELSSIFEDDLVTWDYRITQDLESIINDDQLDDHHKRQLILECIDSNMLYLPYSEIMDRQYKISEEDKKWSNAFYQLTTK